MPLMPQAPAGAPPPELMQMLMGEGGPPNPAQTGPSQRPPGMKPGEDRKILEEMIKMADVYRAMNNDPESLAVVTKVVNDLMKLIAMEQKQADGALGVSPQAKFLRRQAA